MPVYLDYNATSPLCPQAAAKMAELSSVPCNASSVHSFGRRAKKELENARKIIAEAVSAWGNEVVFTASGTEANITALQAFPGRRILVSAIEHSSILVPAQNVGAGVVGVDKNGVVDLVDLERKLAFEQGGALVCIMLAGNETGVIQPVQEAAEICKKYGALLHVDAVQALGKIPVDFSLLGADTMSISAHKCGGAVGAAALIVKNNLTINPLLIGGGQESGRRAGTENIPAIAAFAAAVENFDFAKMKELRLLLDKAEEKMIAAGGVVFGKTVPRLPNTICVAMSKLTGEVQLINFDLKGYAVSAGAACSSGKVGKSHVLAAMGVKPELASRAIRISGGYGTTAEEIEKFTELWTASSFPR